MVYAAPARSGGGSSKPIDFSSPTTIITSIMSYCSVSSICLFIIGIMIFMLMGGDKGDMTKSPQLDLPEIPVVK